MPMKIAEVARKVMVDGGKVGAGARVASYSLTPDDVQKRKSRPQSSPPTRAAFSLSFALDLVTRKFCLVLI